eukprot:917825-Pyramimonas_sp.AAC.1
MSARNSAPALRMEYVTTLKPPDLVATHEVARAYGTLMKNPVADDRRCCRWPDTRLALQSSFPTSYWIGGTDGGCMAASAA